MVASDRTTPPERDPVVIWVDRLGYTSVLDAVIDAVASREDVPTTELNPLYHRIDPDALETLVDHARRHDAVLEVEFTFEGHRVLVASAASPDALEA